ncbi:MAG: TonB-dependent receptor [Sphingomicrobium sp.]
MKHYTSRTRFAAAASPMALAVAMLVGASPVSAQDTTDPQADPNVAVTADAQAVDTSSPTDATKEGEIVVKGFRAALQSSVNVKKRTDQVVESVTAEDIGKLPDNGIGESIARLPGVSAQRSQGRANIISIRGFGPDFSVTTLNGREQTTTNDSRAVEFDQFPSEILNQVVIYKTPAADLTSQGLVGTIDLRTIRPLSAGKRIIAIGARGSYVDQKLQPDSHDKGYRAYGTYVDQFNDGMFGVALSASYTNEPYQTKDWNSWGYSNLSGTDSSQVFNGIKTWVESSDLKRLGLNGTVQARLSDNLLMTWDAFYSNFKDHVNQRGFEFPGNGQWPLTNVSVTDGLVTSGTFNNVVGIVENYASDRDADLYSAGWNVAYDGHNGWKGFADLSWSRTDRTDDFIQTTAGTGRGRSGATDNISFDWTNHGPEFGVGLDYSDPSLIMLTDTQGWGWFNGPINQAGYDNLRRTRDDLKQVHAEIERELGSFISSVKLGVNYMDRSKRLRAEEAYLVPHGGVDEIAIPSDLLLDPVNLDRGFGPILTYDPRKLVGAGILDVVAAPWGDQKAYKVVEKIWTPYIMGIINTQLGSTELTGNVGVQAVHTDQSSTGLVGASGVPDLIQSTKGRKYWEILPSLNLSFRMPNDFVIRFAASKQHIRPRMPDMANNFNYFTDLSLGGIINGNGGNPLLKPYAATGVDLNFEKYFGSKGYIALQTFYKHMDRYIANGFTAFDYSGYPPPTNLPPVSTQGILYGQVNTKGGYIYGAELAGTLPFDLFSPALGGFGLTGGLGYTKTKVKDFNGNDSTIPGYSKWVASLTAFYESHGFNLRGSMRYRSSYQGDFALYSGGLERQTALAETIFDAQVGYDFPEGSAMHGLSLYLQGQNLTDERSATVADPSIPYEYLKYQTYGRRFLAGFTYKFGAEAPPPELLPPAPPPPPPPPPATQTCMDGSVILATDACPLPPPPPPPPAPEPERG